MRCLPLTRPVMVDREMWEKIVLNLLSNAFKFTLQGTVRVRLHELDDAVELSVQDTGAGIPAADQLRIFDRFHRVAGTPARTFEGSGIGLSLVRELARMHGGDVRVASDEGRGATFTVTLPVRAAESAAASPEGGGRAVDAGAYVEEARRWMADADLPDRVADRAAGPGDPSEAQARILVVDDNADMRDYLRRLFAGRWTVELAANGRDALERIDRQVPDLIVTDVMMPEVNGVQLLQEVRRRPGARMTPVIMLSARSGEDARVGGLEAGADDYVIKPFSARELVARVRTQLDLSQLRRETAVQNDRLLRLLEDIDHARQSAEAANRAKDEFMAMLSHELRNPLSPILTALQLMSLRGDRGAENERAIIERQVRHVVRLVDDLLDVSRIARGKIELKRERVEASDIVAKAIETASTIFEQKQHLLTVEVAPEGLALDGDPMRLQQVLFNLLYNAAKYTEPRGTIAVTAVRNGERIELRVRDSGIGIEPRMLPTIFSLFVQEREAVDRAQGGLGLGLAIVRNLVELHGGEVAATSAGRGRGSEFVVSLPAAAPQPADRAATAQPAAARPGAGSGVRVLVVDDNRDAAEMLATALTLAGFEALIATDGPAAIRLAETFTPHAGLLDLGMPFMDGFEVAERLRLLPHPPELLIAVSGYGSDSARQLSRERGFGFHLVKPVDLDEVTRLLGQVAPARR